MAAASSPSLSATRLPLGEPLGDRPQRSPVNSATAPGMVSLAAASAQSTGLTTEEAQTEEARMSAINRIRRPATGLVALIAALGLSATAPLSGDAAAKHCPKHSHLRHGKCVKSKSKSKTKPAPSGGYGY